MRIFNSSVLRALRPSGLDRAAAVFAAPAHALAELTRRTELPVIDLEPLDRACEAASAAIFNGERDHE